MARLYPGKFHFAARVSAILMTVDSVDEADRLLKALPLGQADLLTFDLMPIGPLLPLGMLMKN